HGQDILMAYLHGRSFNNLVNKLIHRPLWSAALESIDPTSNEFLIYSEDLFCTALIYTHAKSYCAIEGTYYVYKWRSDSTMNTQDPTRVAQSVRSLTNVARKLDLLLSRHAEPSLVAGFLHREVGWAVDLLEKKLTEPLDPELNVLLNSLRIRYCPATP